jgi:type VI secretion system protein ImpK
VETTATRPSFLVALFHEFYREVLAAKRRVASEAGSAPAGIWQDLLTALERQALALAGSAGTVAGEIYGQAQYLMAALADEIFLHLDWPGREAWQEHLLEARLFGTHRAGDLFFTRLDQLLARSDPAWVGLARVHLLALGLGFEGRYRGRLDAASQLAAYRRRLHQFIYQRDPGFEAGRERLLPQAYGATLDEGSGARLPYLRRWLLAFVALIALWFGISYPLWRELVGDLEPILERIVS